MEKRLQAIEEKLDFIIDIFKVNPEYETFVKSALRNKEIERIKKEVPVKNQERKSKILDFIQNILENKTHSFEFINTGFHYGESKYGIAPKDYCLPYEIELINALNKNYCEQYSLDKTKFDVFLFIKDNCPLFQAKVIELFGEELSVEKCIEELTI